MVGMDLSKFKSFDFSGEGKKGKMWSLLVQC